MKRVIRVALRVKLGFLNNTKESKSLLRSFCKKIDLEKVEIGILIIELKQ